VRIYEQAAHFGDSETMTTSYSSLQKSFHWLTALLIVALVALGWGMVALPPSPEKLQFYSWHKWIGMTVLLLTGGRLVCRWWSGTPRHREMPAWMRMSAAANHAGIYLLLLALPILGWLMSSASGFPVVMLGLVPLPNLVSPDPDLAENLKAAHRFAGWGLLALLAVHVAAALLHRLVRGDGVLAAIAAPAPDR
jgi:cytochrome b561